MATTTPGTDAHFTEGPLIEPQDAALTRSGAQRIAGIDMMRGLVIAIMVLDHVRDYFHIDVALMNPTDATRTSVLLYLTRWITHLCAPTFVMLAGVSIYMQRTNGKTGGRLTRFLLSRGLWLVLLEVTIISFAWNFGPPPAFVLQVIWAIGWSMILMAPLAHLPAKVVLVIGAAFSLLFPALIVGLMGMPGPNNPPSTVMQLMLTGGFYQPLTAIILYPVLPWAGIMLIGFGLGPIFKMEPGRRRWWLLRIAAGLLALFFVMRGLNGYGDPFPWRDLDDPVRTTMSFFDVLKYPPVPAFIAVTLGLSMLLFLAVEHLKGWLAVVLLAFGRTPLFTYVCHLYIIHAAMLAAATATGRPEVAISWISQQGAGPPAQPWGVPLWGLYPIWIGVLLALVPLAKWMEGLKRRRRDWWLSYV